MRLNFTLITSGLNNYRFEKQALVVSKRDAVISELGQGKVFGIASFGKEITEDEFQEAVTKAIQSDDSIAIEALLSLLPQLKNPEFLMPILFEAICLGSCHVVELMLQFGVSENCVFEEAKTTPLHVAARHGKLKIVRILIEAGANIHHVCNGETILHIAASSNNCDLVKYLLSFQLNVNAENQNRNTPVHLAAINGNLPMVMLFAKNEARLDLYDNNQETITRMAVRSGNCELLQYLVGLGVVLERSNKLGNTLLYEATLQGNIEMVRLLIELGQDLQATNYAGSTMAHAATKSGSIPLLETFIEKGVDPLWADNEGNSCLDIAASRGDLPLLDHLLAKYPGRSLLAKSGKGRTLFHHVAASKNLECMKWLLQHLPDAASQRSAVCTRDNEKNSPLHMAAVSGDLEMAKFLVEKGGDVYEVLVKGLRFLHCIIRSGNLKLLEYFLEYPLDVNLQDHDRQTPLYVATQEGRLDMVELLLAKGAKLPEPSLHFKFLEAAIKSGNIHLLIYFLTLGFNCNIQGPDRNTPLHIAALSGRLDMVQLLCQNGADAFAINRMRDTALHLAASSENRELVKWLVGIGLDCAARNASKETPLYIAVRYSRYKHVDILTTKKSAKGVNNQSLSAMDLMMLPRNLEENPFIHEYLDALSALAIKGKRLIPTKGPLLNALRDREIEVCAKSTETLKFMDNIAEGSVPPLAVLVMNVVTLHSDLLRNRANLCAKQ